MKSNLLRSLFNYVRQLAKQLVKLPLTNAFIAVVDESRLKKLLPHECTLSQTNGKMPEHQADKNQETMSGSPTNPESLKWAAYQEKGGQWDYERWRNTYHNNIKRALQTHISVNQYHHEIGRGMREVTIAINGKNEKLPLADIDALKGIEVRYGKYCSRSKTVMNKMARHENLVKKGWDITWKIEGTASLPLLKELKKAGININY